MTYQYVNTGIDMTRNFTDIEGPDGMVSHAEVFTALNQRDIDAQAMKNQHVMIQNRDREIERLMGQFGELGRVLRDEFDCVGAGPVQMAMRLLREQRQRLGWAQRVTDAAREVANCAVRHTDGRWTIPMEPLTQLDEILATEEQGSDQDSDPASIDQIAADIAADDAREGEAADQQPPSFPQQLYDALHREGALIDQLTEAGKDLDRYVRVIDVLLGMQSTKNVEAATYEMREKP